MNFWQTSMEPSSAAGNSYSKSGGGSAALVEVLWYGALDQVRVTQDGKLRFIFKDATEIGE